MQRPTAISVVVLLMLIWVACAQSAIADEPKQPPTQETVDFAKDVYPILRRSCFECHGKEKQEADLRLDRREDALNSGMIDAGSPDDSELLRRIKLPRDDDEVMPAIGDPLAKRQVAIVRRWIEQGAEWPEDFEVGRHWAYVAPKRPELPKISNSEWAKSPMDRFVLRRLEGEGLSPSPPAAPEKLVRRVFLDLIGLPPSPKEVDKWASRLTAWPAARTGSDADAPADSNTTTELTERPHPTRGPLGTQLNDRELEKLVDELLERPQFGERWARPWLDLARYADSHGFQRDNLREIWAYRDWVIRALNADMPFDQFTIEQIAGDLLPDATESQKIATGFHRSTPTNVEAGSLPEETRIEQVIDRVNTTGAVWLGTTLECCQCHDHKYDPFTMKDYYQLLAFYNSTQREADRANPKTPSSIKFMGPSMPLPDPQRDAQQAELKKQLAEVKRQQAARRKELTASLESWALTLAKELAEAPRTHVLDVAEFESEGTTDTIERLDDGSVLLVGGDPPDTDVYTVRVRAQLSAIRGIRLDVLRHELLPGKGPGRGDPKRRNFVLNDFSAQVHDKSAGAESDRVLDFSSATASFSQVNWDVAGAIDNDPKTGWAIAPQFDQSHWATFVLAEPLDLSEDSELVFTLTQDWGRARTIGCFRMSAITGSLDAESVPEEIVKATAKPAANWPKQDRQKLLDYRIKQDSRSQVLTREIAKLEKQIKQYSPDTTLVMIELDEPRKTHIFERGDYRNPGQPVQPGTPAVLHPMPVRHGESAKRPPNRLTLARWLASPDNPLVARVTVNRWWAELFGQGIVTTVEDFGVKGEPPSHPELLDWLAVEFIENGWSMKKLLKTIVLSATYQQSSRITPELLQKDDRNRLLARGPRLRMSAEMIRDNALAISGLLNLKQFGPPIRPYQPDGIWRKVGGTSYNYEVSPGAEQHRRGIYVVLKRGSPYPSFMNFDATARLACTVKRSRTNTPLQALTLLNDPVYVEAAKALAKRVRSEKSESLDEQLAYAFQLCTARQPTESEQATLRQLYQQQIEAHRQRKAGATKSDADSAAWYSVTTLLLNMHETITKD